MENIKTKPQNKQSTPEQRKAYAKECTELAKTNGIPFELVLTFKKDINRAKQYLEVCSKLELTEEDLANIKEGGLKKVEAFKKLGLPFKGVNIDKLQVLPYIVSESK